MRRCTEFWWWFCHPSWKGAEVSLLIPVSQGMWTKSQRTAAKLKSLGLKLLQCHLVWLQYLDFDDFLLCKSPFHLKYLMACKLSWSSFPKFQWFGNSGGACWSLSQFRPFNVWDPQPFLESWRCGYVERHVKDKLQSLLNSDPLLHPADPPVL